MSYQMCYGKYVSNDPCYPFCSKPDGSGCDYSPMANPSGSNPFGLTGDPYSVTYSDQGRLTGNFTTRTYVPTIDPYQTQVPPKNFHGFVSNRNEYTTFSSNSSQRSPFLSMSAESITQDGTTTTLTAVPRFSTQNFFQKGQMDGLSTTTPANGGGNPKALPHCMCGDGTTCRGSLSPSAATKCCCCAENAQSEACQEMYPTQSIR